jgi:hypothetical protein
VWPTNRSLQNQDSKSTLDAPLQSAEFQEMQPENNALTAIQQKLPGRPFEPGKSGNPGGRPRVLANVQEAARQYTAEAMEALATIMRDNKAPPAARVAAANSLLDRGWGRAPTFLKVTDEGAAQRGEEMIAAFAKAAENAQNAIAYQRTLSSRHSDCSDSRQAAIAAKVELE